VEPGTGREKRGSIEFVRLLPKTLFVVGMATGLVWGCECKSLTMAPACEKIGTMDVVFVGTAKSLTSYKPAWARVRQSAYRFAVERSYRGLRLGTAEVLVDPDNSTSCGTRFELGVRYLVYASRREGEADVVFTSVCHGSHEAARAAGELRFLEAFRRGETTTAVYGRVLQNVDYSERRRGESGAEVVGAEVTLQGKRGVLIQTTDRDGAFRFDGIPAGRWTISAKLRPFVPDPGTAQVDVVEGGCVEVFPQLSGRAEFTGVLRNEKGEPAKRMRVQLLRRGSRGEWARAIEYWQDTDAWGRFRYTNLPSGEYLFGYEIEREDLNDSAYRTQYYPDAVGRATAKVIHLAPGEKKRLEMQLAAPRTPRSIRVEVVWPDGRPASNHFLQLLSRDENLGALGGGRNPAQHRGVFDLNGWEDRTYDLRARFWIDDLGTLEGYGKERIALSNVVRLAPGRGPTIVRLVLRKRMLSGAQ